MRLAFAQAGLGFFGTIIFMLVFLNDSLKKMPDGQQYIALGFWAFVVAGAVFFFVLRKDELEKRDSAKTNDKDRMTDK